MWNTLNNHQQQSEILIHFLLAGRTDAFPPPLLLLFYKIFGLEALSSKCRSYLQGLTLCPFLKVDWDQRKERPAWDYKVAGDAIHGDGMPWILSILASMVCFLYL
jgi:hypothetical protein